MITRTQIGEICSKPHPNKDITTALMDLFQDEIDRLKAQHAEEIEKIMQKNKGGQKMEDLKNWKELSKGYYRFVVAPGFCYEIFVKNWSESNDILTSNADLFATMSFRESKENWFTRELIINNALFECLKAAVNDYNTNCKD